VRIARFTTGDDPQYGVVTGDLDEYGEPAEDSIVVTLAGDPMYAGVKPLDEQHRLADVRLLARSSRAARSSRSAATTPRTPPRWAASRPRNRSCSSNRTPA
jgi:hypothetical protein